LAQIRVAIKPVSSRAMLQMAPVDFQRFPVTLR
jgi:hypothetical protein